MNGERLFEEVAQLAAEPGIAGRMGAAARRLRIRDAARRAADVLESAAAAIDIDSPEAETIQYINVFSRHQHLHFAGIGGIGMSGIAEVLLIWVTRSAGRI